MMRPTCSIAASSSSRSSRATPPEVPADVPGSATVSSAPASRLHSVALVLIDISGYTRFTKLHRLSALHAEQIIGELLESIIQRSSPPLLVHEILGDAVSFYAESDGSAALVQEVR